MRCCVLLRRAAAMLLAVTGELDSLLHDYWLSVIARSIATKQSSYLSVTYVSLSSSGLLNGIIFVQQAPFFWIAS
jgi:hypothetical protein